MTMKDENALIARASEFAIATRMDSIQEVLEANLGGEMINQFSLDRVKICGRRNNREIPTLMGDEASPSLEGVIVAWKTVRAYYDKPFEGGSEPPVCASDDGRTGFGTPFGEEAPITHECRTCPLNQWGSAGKTKKACQERKLLFILRKDSHLPILVSVPGSLKEVNAFFTRLPVPYWQVLVSLGLTKDKNPEGIPYSKVNVKVLSVLTKEDGEIFEQYSKMFSAAVKQVRFDPSLIDETA